MTEAIGDDPIPLPGAAVAPVRRPLPLVAATVPIAGAIVLWVVTGSALSLCFAALAPLVAIAAYVDARRAARKDLREDERRLARECTEADRRIDEAHQRERALAWRRHPDLGMLQCHPERVWRSSDRSLLVGSGARVSAVRTRGGDHSSATQRSRARIVREMPVLAPAADGLAIAGPPALAAALARAVLARALLAASPDEMALTGGAGAEWDWTRDLPHRSGAGQPLTIGPRGLTLLAPGEVAPAGCRAVVTITAIGHAVLVESESALPQRVRVPMISREQAAAIAVGLARRGGPRAASCLRRRDLPAPPAAPNTLSVAIGCDPVEGSTTVVDLVTDGPHAVVVGMTGSGKSELLTTWIAAMCASYPPERVVFVLTDFKGGSSFDALTGLPHVTAVLTDLDEVGARRGLASLRAEMRVREDALVRARARDVTGTALPRLVIVVDEYAALVQSAPDLLELFADLAARGRALGMHLILGTQRASGVIRDAVLANVPLRLALRMQDAADSRLVIGSDRAARLPGGDSHRGRALVRRAADAAAADTRIALTDAADIAHLGDRARAAGSAPPRRPWLADLPAVIGLGDVARDGNIHLAVADDPDRQRRLPVTVPAGGTLLVRGAPRSGRSTALAVIAAQSPHSVWLGSELEAAWDEAEQWQSRLPAADASVLIDDVDVLVAAFPPEHALTFVASIEHLVRAAGTAGYRVAITLQRTSGPLGRLTDLIPRRLLLAQPSRLEHVAAGGDARSFAAGMPPGRGECDGRRVQVLAPPVEDAASPRVSRAPAAWEPLAPLTAVVVRSRASAERIGRFARARGALVHRVGDEVAGAGESPLVLIGHPDEWMQSWRLLLRAREGDLLVEEECTGAFGALTGDRTITPYCRPGAQRALLVRGGAAAVRVTLPATVSA